MNEHREKFILVLSNIEFTFREESELLEFARTIFRYAEDKKGLYEEVMTHTTDLIISLCKPEGNNNKEEEQVLMLKGLGLVSKAYGPVYDPDQEIFKILEDNNGLIEQTLM